MSYHPHQLELRDYCHPPQSFKALALTEVFSMDLKESALAYEPPQTKNIADLEKVSVDLNVEERTFKEGTPDEFKVKVVVIEGEEFRVPLTVLSQLKEHLQANPSMEWFKVRKAGTGMSTVYTVVPLLSVPEPSTTVENVA